MKIKVMIKNIFGRELIYPLDELGRKLAALIRHDTFTREDIRKIKDLGYEIEVEQEVVNL